LLPAGQPRRLTRQGLYMIHRIAWTSDGQSLLYDTEEGGHETFFTWRVAADGTSPPVRLELVGVGAWQPAISGDRLAFTRWLFDTDIVRFSPDRPREAFLSSSYWDGSSHFSTDGQRIAFESMRSGEMQEIWLASADGSNPVQLTHGPGRMQGSPAWSPDGRWIAFDSEGADGHWDIWTIEPSGAAPHRLTTHPGDENVPRWSHDGRYVYFGARRDGKTDIRRIPAEGGVDEEVVPLGPESVGVVQESSDGKTLYFTTGGVSPLFAHPLAGGPDRKLADCVNGIKSFVVVEPAVYYAACRAPGIRGPEMFDVALRRLDLRSGDDRILGTLHQFRGTLTVSPDEKTILYQSVTKSGSNLMLVEGFR
jgi:Tol biopolymer transport system component